MVLNRSLRNPLDKSFVVNLDSKEKKLIEYADLISPGVLNENEVKNSLGFFSTKAPKKKQIGFKKNSSDDHLKDKRKRLEKYFSTVDLDSWSERNFIYSNKNSSEDWHDDLHYIVLKQQERSNLFHQLWLFLMLALFCILLISIAGIVYSKNSVVKNQDQTNSYEFIQKFIDDFNHTEPKFRPDMANRYEIKHDESNESWLQREAKYLSSVLGARENEPLNLTKKENGSDLIENSNKNEKATRSVELIQDPNFKSTIEVDYELMMDESSFVEKIEDKVEDSFKSLTENSGLKKLIKKMKDIF